MSSSVTFAKIGKAWTTLTEITNIISISGISSYLINFIKDVTKQLIRCNVVNDITIRSRLTHKTIDGFSTLKC